MEGYEYLGHEVNDSSVVMYYKKPFNGDLYEVTFGVDAGENSLSEADIQFTGGSQSPYLLSEGDDFVDWNSDFWFGKDLNALGGDDFVALETKGNHFEFSGQNIDLGAGNDTLKADILENLSADGGVVQAGAGDDLIEYAALRDATILGGEGNDTIHASYNGWLGEVRGDAGDDVIIVDEAGLNDRYEKNDIPFERAYGGEGNDTFDLTVAHTYHESF